MKINFKLKRIKNKEGVHTCIIVNAQTGVPLIYENLYLSIISRSSNYSYSTIEAIAGALLYFSKYLQLKGVVLADKNKGNNIITGSFVYDLMTYLSVKKSKSNVINIKSKRVVSENCLHYKLTSIEKYLVWYYINIENENFKYINLISRIFKDIKPKINKTGVYTDCEEKSLDKQQISMLLETIEINSIKNPFKECVRIRNELIIDILLETGIRGGELLNLRIDDVNITKCEIHIVRRPDSIEDTRIRQPLVKTLGRKIPISKNLSEKIQKYIDISRSNQVLSINHKYLLVSHSDNSKLGSALTITGFQKIFIKLGESDPLLKSITAHSLRHTWNIKYSENMYRMADPEHYVLYEKVRNYLMGWKNTSRTADTYTQRYLVNEATKIMNVINSTKLLNKENLKSGKAKLNSRKSVFGF